MSYTPVVNAQTLTLYLGIAGTGRATASSTTLDLVAFGTVYNPRPSITFTADDVGMPIAIVGGGPVDADMPPINFVQGALFHTTVAAYVSPTQVTLAAAPDTSIYNTGFATVILYRPVPFASDVANVPMTFQFSSSIAPGTNDTLQFSTLNSLGGVDNPYVDRFGPVLLGQPVYMTRDDPVAGTLDVFGGYIDTLQTSSMPGVAGVPYSWSAQCVSWSGLARRRVVPPATPQIFTATAGDAVFRKLVLDYLVDDGVAVTAATAPAITLAAPVGSNIGQLLDQVVSLVSDEDTAWYWTADAWRTFILATRTGTAAPWDVTSGDDLLAGNTPYQQSITATHNQMANFVYAIGSATLLNTLNATIVGNGTATTFNLPQPVGAVPTITLNSGAQTVGILGVDTGKDWYWSQGSNVLTQDTGGTVLISTDTLLAVYTPETPAVAQSPNVVSLQSLQAIEATSASYEHSISISAPILPADLLAFATAYEIEYGMPATTCQLYTLRPGLATGQLQTIDLPEAGIPSGSYLIATIQMSTIGNTIVWQYTAFGGANIGDAITALTQFINRQQAVGTIVTPSTPITGQAVAASTGNSITLQQPLPFAAIVATLPQSVVAGNLLVVVAVRDGLANPIVITDSQGNTWTQAVYASSAGFFPNSIALAWAVASATGSITVTSVSGNSAEYITVTEISGIDSAAPVDVFGSASGSAPSITTTEAGDVIISGVCWQGASVPTATAPETIIGSGLAGGPAGNIAVALANKSTAGSFTTTLSSNGGANPPDNFPVYISVAFKPAPPTAPPAQTTTVLANPQGTVSHSTGALTAGDPVLGNGGGDVKIGVSGQLVPAGGTAGQVLSKNSSTNYDTSWTTAADDILINGATTLNVIKVSGTQVWIGQTEIQIDGTFI